MQVQNNINVEIKNGGISYIRITDNGKGIEKMIWKQHLKDMLQVKLEVLMI